MKDPNYMTVIKKYISIALSVAALLLMLAGCSKTAESGPIKILILSGRNNHEWQKTTPLLARIYTETRLFSVTITDLPDTLTYKQLKNFNVVVSNWNTWPDNNLRFPARWEKDFSKYINGGGGAIFIHAGASSFYGWDDYHKIGIGRWGKDTKHGEQTRGKISGFDREHPITKVFKDFYITDEIWEKTDIYPGARPVASVTATDTKDSHQISENCAFVNSAGRGLSFFTTLGHNERALLNSGLQTMILRATQWVAKREVTIEPTSEIREKTETAGQQLSWEQSDTTIALKKGSDIIWQFNFNNRFGRPYFHPLSVNNSVLTCTSPPDHPWHLGFWFCWKFINGVNYWEYLDDFKSEKTGYKSAGITKITRIEIIRNPDFSADIHLALSYSPADSGALLTENRNIHISSPSADGSYYIDHENIFDPLADKVILDRTPVQKEPGGRTWGGYAGLSIRFSQDFNSPQIISPDTADNCKKNPWVYMGFNTLSGDTAGMCIFQNMKYTTPNTSWYIISTPSIPFFYYSPAVLYDGKLILRKGDKLQLRYRAWMVPGKTSKEELQEKYNEYAKN
jgi:type 1 glutamine amidotransferase